jgi:hypothetical protein
MISSDSCYSGIHYERRSMGLIEYSSNNSGGSWWLEDKDWEALDRAGWTVHWYADRENLFFKDEDGRFLGALAMSAEKACDDPEVAIEEWERITGQSSLTEGCNCCGPPHSFSFTDNDGNTRFSSVYSTGSERSWY